VRLLQLRDKIPVLGHISSSNLSEENYTRLTKKKQDNIFIPSYKKFSPKQLQKSIKPIIFVLV